MGAKKITVRNSDREKLDELDVDSIEQGLKDVREKVRAGELEVPCVLEFSGDGLDFTITVNNTDAAEQVARQGFMF